MSGRPKSGYSHFCSNDITLTQARSPFVRNDGSLVTEFMKKVVRSKLYILYIVVWRKHEDPSFEWWVMNESPPSELRKLSKTNCEYFDCVVYKTQKVFQCYVRSGAWMSHPNIFSKILERDFINHIAERLSKEFLKVLFSILILVMFGQLPAIRIQDVSCLVLQLHPPPQ